MSLSSVAAAAKAARDSSFTKAKRGDAVLLEVLHSSTSVGFKRDVYATYHVAKVTSVGRDGAMKAADRPVNCPWPWKFGSGHKRCWIISADKFGGDVDQLLANLGKGADFESVDQAREALRSEAEKMSPAA